MKQYTTGEIRALVSLLGDENAATARVAWDALLACGPAATPFLEAGAEDADARVRGRSRALLEEKRLEQLSQRWRGLSDEPDDGTLDLEAGCLLIAEIAHPDLDHGLVAAQLDQLAAVVRTRCPVAAPITDQVRELCRFLGEELRFRPGEYYDPDNTYLNQVLVRRTGIQMAVSIVYMLVGRRLGLPLHGLGLPGHYMVLAETPGGPLYIDAYGGGRLWTRFECLEYLRALGPGLRPGPLDSYLQPTSIRRTLARVLVNLINIYSHRHLAVREALLRRWLGMLGA